MSKRNLMGRFNRQRLGGLTTPLFATLMHRFLLTSNERVQGIIVKGTYTKQDLAYYAAIEQFRQQAAANAAGE
jgi:hypothetical protein